MADCGPRGRVNQDLPYLPQGNLGRIATIPYRAAQMDRTGIVEDPFFPVGPRDIVIGEFECFRESGRVLLSDIPFFRLCPLPDEPAFKSSLEN